jgi:hypothetical protein
MKQIEDYYNTDEFKNLKPLQKIWLRIKISFLLTITNF